MPKRVIRFAVVLAVLGASASPAQAGIDTWTTGDQVGGSLNAAAVSGPLALAGRRSGGSGGVAFRSVDGGATWERIPGLGYLEVEGLAIDPAPGQPAYAATRTGMWRSLDGGISWAQVTGGLGSADFFTGVSVDTGQPGTVLFRRFSLSGGGVFRSTTGGAGPWTDVSAGIPNPPILDGIVVDPVTHIAWGWRYGSGVYILTPGTTTWNAANVGLPSTSVVGLALDGSGSRRMIVATTAGMATLPATGGPTWVPLNGGLNDMYARALTYDGGGAVYLATLNDALWRLGAGASSWTQLAGNGMPAPFAAFLAGDPAQAGHVLALTSSSFAPNVGLGPLWRTLDGGDAFARAATGIRAVTVGSIAPDPRQAGRVLVGTDGDAVQRSADAGATWGFSGVGLPHTDVRAVAADGADAGIWYAGPAGGGGVYRSSDDGATWVPVGTGDPNGPIVLATIPGRGGIVFTSDGEDKVFRSTNHGDTWEPLPTLPGDVRGIEPDPAQSGAIWVARGADGVSRIAEGEPSWTDRSAGLAGVNVTSLAVDPRAPATLFAGTSDGGVYRSTDAGLTWVPASNGIPDSRITDLVVDPQLPGTVYASTDGGVFRSDDNGANWAQLTGGVSLPAVAGLEFDADGKTLYAGTRLIGLAARTRPTPAAPVTAASGAAPRLVGAPKITGTPRRGRRLLATFGNWTGEPAPALTIAWQRCRSANACTTIARSTATSYTAKTADVGRRLRVHVTAANASGSGAADSAMTKAVRSPPVITQRPLVRGRPRVGRRLRSRGGRFAASPAAKLSRRWQRCPRRRGVCRTIARATRTVYTPRRADLGYRLRLVVTARSSLGRKVAVSARSSVVSR